MILKALSLVPSSVWIGLAAALALFGAFWAIDHNGYQRGSEAVRVEWAKERVAYAAALQREKDRQATVVEKVVVEYRDRVKVIKEKGDEIVKAIPYYIRATCALPGAWRVLHDAAATGVLPEDPERVAAAAAPVDDVTAAEVVATNYAACRETAARLTALQQLVKGLQ